MRFLGRLPWIVIMAWLLSVSICYIYIVDRKYSRHFEPTEEQIFEMVDAFVFISIGKLAQDTLADYSIATLRKIGSMYF